jgi:fatty acid CoA ligase FadD9
MRDDAELRHAVASRRDLAWIGQGRSTLELLERACRRYGPRPCLAARASGSGRRRVTYAELWARVESVAAGLAPHVAPGRRVGILGFGGLEWVVADLACLYLGAVSVSIASTVGREDFRRILDDMELGCLCAEYEPLRRLAAECRSVPAVVCLDRAGPGEERWRWLDDLEKPGARVPPAEPGPLFSVIYTSGSTGSPRPVAFSHPRWQRTMRDGLRWRGVPRVTVSYMPLAHGAGRSNLYANLMAGGLTHLVAGPDTSTLLDDIREARPTHLWLVPRLAGSIYQQFLSELLRAGGEPGTVEAMLAQRAGRAVAGRMRDSVLGDRLVFVTIGSAPTAPHIVAFLEQGLGLVVTDVYASTEFGPISVDGRVHAYVDYRLVDRPELGFTRADRPHPRGELAVRSPRATTGHDGDGATVRDGQDEVDGYRLTGDLVVEIAPGRLRWLDRSQGVLRLAQGEFVNVSQLEELFAQSPWIEQVYLYANPLREYLLAVLVPAPASGLSGEELRDRLRQELGRLASQAGLRGHEVPRDFLVEPRLFSADDGLLTDSGKPRRSRLGERYGPRLEQLYERLEQRRTRAEPAADTTSTTRQVLSALALTLGVEPARPWNDSFVHLGGDSLAAVEFSVRLRQTCGLAISVSDLLDPDFKLGRLLDSTPPPHCDLVHGPAARWATVDDLRSPRLLDPVVTAQPPPIVSPPRVVLLTGASGFLGRCLSVELARALPADGRVVCLVRPAGRDDLRQRLLEAFTSAPGRQAVEVALEADKLEVVAGDLTRPRLGLSEADYERMCHEVDVVLHAGALVNHLLEYRDLFAPNVLGTAEVIRLARRHRPKPVHFVSTAALAAGAAFRAVPEHRSAAQLWPRRAMAAPARSYAHGYVTSKWAGEVLLEAAHQRCGLPITLSRCSALLPHSRWAEHNRQDTLVRLLVGISRAAIAPVSFYAGRPQHLDGLPVDLVARFLAALSLNHETGRRTYHVSNSNWNDGISLDTFVARMSRTWPLEHLDYPTFWRRSAERWRMRDVDEQRRSPLPLWEHWRRPLTGAPHLDTTEFAARLRELCGLAIPSLDDEYVGHVVTQLAGS